MVAASKSSVLYSVQTLSPPSAAASRPACSERSTRRSGNPPGRQRQPLPSRCGAQGVPRGRRSDQRMRASRAWRRSADEPFERHLLSLAAPACPAD
jgi:hypothetical protein